MSEEAERARCSAILRDSIAFVVDYPQKMGKPISKDFRTALTLLINTLTEIKSEIDQGKAPRSERLRSKDFDLDELTKAEEIMEGLK